MSWENGWLKRPPPKGGLTSTEKRPDRIGASKGTAARSGLTKGSDEMGRGLSLEFNSPFQPVVTPQSAAFAAAL